MIQPRARPLNGVLTDSSRETPITAERLTGTAVQKVLGSSCVSRLLVTFLLLSKRYCGIFMLETKRCCPDARKTRCPACPAGNPEP